VTDLDALVEEAKAGNREAFGDLLRTEVSMAYRVARVIVRSDVAAQDAVQEACIRAWRDLSRLRDAHRWSGWFRRVVVRAAIDEARRDGRARRPGPILRAVTADSAEALARRDLVARALADLTPDERALLALRFVSDLEVPDLARALGIPNGTAKSRLHRILAKLRDRLHEMDR
jgi:RNA polymerase sigma-70 factor (ECF subfamily)